MNPLLNLIKNSDQKNDIFHENLKIVLNNEKIDLNIPKVDPPLYLASRKGKIHIVKELLNVKNIDIDVYNYRYMTPLLGSIFNRKKDEFN